MSGRNSGSVRIADSDRARVPFAMIGVVLLVSSVAIVGFVNSQPDPKVDVDTSSAVDQTVAASQTALREAVQDAVKEAARKPLTKTTDSPAGRALSDSNATDQFINYVKLRIYLQAQEKLDDTGQTLDDGVETTVSLPRLNYSQASIEKALDRVHLRAGLYDGSMDYGRVNATVEGVRVEVTKDGREVAERDVKVSVSLGTTLFELWDRTQTYEKRLEMGFFHEDAGLYNGFGRKFAARIYPVAYAKAYHDRMIVSKNAFRKKLLPNRETEVLANSAIYDIQQSVYGEKDPLANRRMKGAWACFAARIAEDLYAAHGGSRGSRSKNFSTYVSAKDFCKVTRFIYGENRGFVQQSQRLDAMLSGVFSGTDSSRATEEKTIKVDQFANASYHDILGDGWEPAEGPSPNGSENFSGSIERFPDRFFENGEMSDVVDSIYTLRIDADVTTNTSTGSKPTFVENPTESDPNGSYGQVDSWYEVVSTTKSIDHREVWSGSNDRVRPLHVFRIEITNEYVKKEKFRFQCEPDKECDSHPSPVTNSSDSTSSVDYVYEFKIRSNHSIHANVSTRGIDADYRSGGSAPPFTPKNFENGLNKSIEQLSDIDPSSVESSIRSQLDFGAINNLGDLHSQVSGSALGVQFRGQPTIRVENHSGMDEWLRSELRAVHERVISDVEPVEVSQTSLVASDNPFANLTDQIRANESDYVYAHDGPYYSAADKTRAELRKLYIERLYDWVQRVNAKRTQSRNDASSQMGGGLGEQLKFAQKALSGDLSVTNGSMRSSSLLGDVQFEVDGEPTYLSLKPVTRAAVPAARPGQQPLSSNQDTFHAPMAARHTNHLPFPGLPLIPWPGYWYVTVNGWQVDVKGEYARFSVTAKTGDPGSDAATTFVRQEMPIVVEIAGAKRHVGDVEPINFNSSTQVGVVVPGKQIYPGGDFGVGDMGGYRRHCSATWDYTGPGFFPYKVNPAGCSNRPAGGGGGMNLWIPTGSGGGFFGGTNFTVEGDGDVDIGATEAEDDCEPKDLADAVGRYSDADNVPDKVGRIYCALDTDRERGHFEDFLRLSRNGDVPGETVGDTWEDTIESRQIDEKNVERIIHMLTEGGPNSIKNLHDVQSFHTASDLNPDPEDDDVNAHSEPGIVANVTTRSDDSFARIYGTRPDDMIKGGFAANRFDLLGLDAEAIIDGYALWDEGIVEPGTKPWGDYECVGKVFLDHDDEGPIDFQVSATDSFSAANHPITESLDGGYKQIAFTDRIDDNESWVPLGQIEYFSDHPEELLDNFSSASPGDNLADGKCGEDSVWGWEDPDETRDSETDPDENYDEEGDKDSAYGDDDARTDGGEDEDYGESDDDDGDGDDDDKLEVTFIDVGKGQSILVEGPEDTNVLIDAGTKMTGASHDSYGETVEEALERNEVEVIDSLVITHGHEDHVSYVDSLVDDGDVELKNVYWNRVKDSGSDAVEDALRAIENRAGENDDGLPIQELYGDGVDVGDELGFDPAVDVVLHNPDTDPDQVADPDADEESIALEIKYEGSSFLVSSDVYDADKLPQDHVDVVTAQHHGGGLGRDANPTDWLNATNPDHFVFLADANSHPKEAVLNRVVDPPGFEEPDLYTSDMHNDVEFVADGGSIDDDDDIEMFPPTIHRTDANYVKRVTMEHRRSMIRPSAGWQTSQNSGSSTPRVVP